MMQKSSRMCKRKGARDLLEVDGILRYFIIFNSIYDNLNDPLCLPAHCILGYG